MASRYHGRAASAADPRPPTRSDLFGEGWIGLGAVALSLIAVVALSGSSGAPDGRGEVARALRASLAPAERSLAALDGAFGTLCREPLLLVLDLAPDCETGVITLPDDLFTGRANPRIRSESREFVASAVTTWLARLRALPPLWDSLEAIEIRGHTDALAGAGGYANQLIVSQQRAVATLLFLLGPEGIPSEADRRELERLAVVSGSSATRPPSTCPEATPECRAHWRRVEIRPVFSEPDRRGDWARTIDAVRDSTAAVRDPERIRPRPTR